MSKLRIIGLISLFVAVFVVTVSEFRPTLGKDITSRMAIAHQHDRPIATTIALAEPKVPVTTERVQYATVDGNQITGYLAQPETPTESIPGLMAIHEWWGLNENIEATARRLAGEGYRVLAPDLYGGQTAQTPQKARQLMQAVMENPSVAEDNLQQAYRYLKRDASQVGVIGWCFGGGWSLQSALMLPELDAAVIYYGQLITDPMELKAIDTPILGIFGAQDDSIPVEQVRQFEQALDSLGKNVEIHVYDAGHAFANPSGDRYVPEAAAAAWEETTAFLEQYLASPR